ncbi:MAG: F0F1 ATP synthase subunit delta [Pseudorhodobacter sp.]|nr:F0F1 ATP synthase subunit delta [Rhizobacter sp.]
MAELATLARPYAEALFQVALKGNLKQAAVEIDALAEVSANAQLRQFADSPKTTSMQVVNVMTSVVKLTLSEASINLLRTVIDNGRLAALPEIAAQFHVLANARAGVSDAVIYSAFDMSEEQVADVVTSLERRFARKLNASVQVQANLIGGIRVVVGDEVLDTSIKARLEQMKAALVA